MNQVEFPFFKSIKKYLFTDKTGTLIWGGFFLVIVIYYVSKNGFLLSYLRWDTQIFMVVSVFLSYIVFTYLKFYSIKYYEQTRFKNWSDSCIKNYPYPMSYQLFKSLFWITRNILGITLWIVFVLLLDGLNREFMENIFGVQSYLLYPCSSIDTLTPEQLREVINFWKVKSIYGLDCD
jgi:hypothetical protein